MALVALIPGGHHAARPVFLSQCLSAGMGVYPGHHRPAEPAVRAHHEPEAGFFSRTSTGEFVARIMNHTASLQAIISNATTVIVEEPVTLISLLAFVLWKETRLTLLALVVMPVCMVPIVVYGRKVRRSHPRAANPLPPS